MFSQNFSLNSNDSFDNRVLVDPRVVLQGVKEYLVNLLSLSEFVEIVVIRE